MKKRLDGRRAQSKSFVALGDQTRRRLARVIARSSDASETFFQHRECQRATLSAPMPEVREALGVPSHNFTRLTKATCLNIEAHLGRSWSSIRAESQCTSSMVVPQRRSFSGGPPTDNPQLCHTVATTRIVKGQCGSEGSIQNGSGYARDQFSRDNMCTVTCQPEHMRNLPTAAPTMTRTTRRDILQLFAMCPEPFSQAVSTQELFCASTPDIRGAFY